MSSGTCRKIPVGRNSLFYEVPTSDVEEVLSGYLYKSPPPSVLTKSMKSWKRRYFVLSMINGHLHELKYYKDENKRDKPIGEIELYETSLLFLQPEAHSMWEWIQKNFRCSSSCVLFMRVIDRDYFLIGENSTEMDGWFNAIFAALKTHTLIPEENRKTRSISEPSHVKTSYNDQELAESEEQQLQKRTLSPSVRRSAPEFITQYEHYDYPRSFMMKTSPKSEDEDDEEEEEEDTGCYMDMASVRKVASAVECEDDLTLQTQKNTMTNLSVSADFCNGQVDKGQDVGHPCERLTAEDKGPDDAFQNTKSGSTGSSRQIPQGSGALNPEQKEICVSQEELKNNVIFSEEAGRPCVSDWKHIQSSGPFHEGDQIVAINDLLTDSLEEVQTYLRRLSKDEVKLTVLRQPGSRPLSGCSA